MISRRDDVVDLPLARTRPSRRRASSCRTRARKSALARTSSWNRSGISAQTRTAKRTSGLRPLGRVARTPASARASATTSRPIDSTATRSRLVPVQRRGRDRPRRGSALSREQVSKAT